jgi:hypothetical protein
MQDMNLNNEHKDLLREGLESEKFTDRAKDVGELLRAKGRHAEAEKLVDMAPLFDKHDFWHNQPVPKFTELVTVDQLNKPIEEKTLAEVETEPLLLPDGFSWCNLNLRNDNEALELYTLLV